MRVCAQAVPLSALRAQRDAEPPQPSAGQAGGEERGSEPTWPAGVLLEPRPAWRLRPDVFNFPFHGVAAPQLARAGLMEAFARAAEGFFAESGVGVAAHRFFPGGGVSDRAGDEAKARSRAHAALHPSAAAGQRAVRSAFADGGAFAAQLSSKRAWCVSSLFPATAFGLKLASPLPPVWPNYSRRLSPPDFSTPATTPEDTAPPRLSAPSVLGA